jgi:hypothetical protein
MLLRLMSKRVAASRAALVLAVAMACGCSSGQAADAADRSAGGVLPQHPGSAAPNPFPPGSRELELISDDWLQLDFGETSLLRVRVSDEDGEPIEDAVVTFALAGRSQDSSLAAVSATSDEDGFAENELIAGTMAAAFSVRITTPGAYETFVDVGVSNSGFGTLHVQADYSGARAVAQRVIFAQAGMDCRRAERMRGDPMVTIGPEEQSAQFIALPASVSYAILAFAESEDGTVVASGCSDAVVVERDDLVTASVAWGDAPLALSGRFRLQADLDAGGPATALGSALRDGAEGVVETDSLGNVDMTHADARFLLDSLDGTLRSEDYAEQPGAITLADAIAQDRAMPIGLPPEQSLHSLLAIKDEGAQAVVPRIVQLTADDFEMLRLFVELTAEDAGSELALTWRPLRVEALPAGSDRAPVAIDLSALDEVLAVADPLAGRDAIELASVRFELPFGALAAQVLREVVSFDVAGHGEEIRTLVGCTALSEWLAAQSYPQIGACDEGCVRAACDRAVTRLVSGAETSLTALDETRPTLTLSGEIELGDTDGDLMVERLNAQMLSGEWESETAGEAGDAVSGAATAEPVTPTVPAE